MFNNILDQGLAIRIITNFIKIGRIPQSFLFYGPEGVGKFLTAKTFAKIVNCKNPSIEDRGEDNCESCHKIEVNKHPDVIIIDNESNNIKIETIRDLIRKVNLKPFEAENKIVILNNAENLTIEAANTLLKTLEEPPENTYIILVTSQIESILSTIKSRCIKIKFNSLSYESIQNILNRKYNIPMEEAKSISLLSEGNMVNAIDLIDREIYSNLQMLFQNIIIMLSSGDIDISKLLDVSVFFDKPKEKEKLIFNKLLNILYLYWRDMLIANLDVVGINKYLQRKESFKISHKGVVEILKLIERIKEDLRYNINLSLAIEYFILEAHNTIKKYKEI